MRIRRSRRQPVFGQIRPLKRRLGAFDKEIQDGKAWLCLRHTDEAVRKGVRVLIASGVQTGRWPVSRSGVGGNAPTGRTMAVSRWAMVHRSYDAGPHGTACAIRSIRAVAQPLRTEARLANGIGRPSGYRSPDQLRASPCPAGGGTADPIAATRTRAVPPTSSAATIDMMICQMSDGIRCFTMPCAA